ncbi:MAG: hypothetical protein ACI91J_004071, partial [Yoonia sp.]
NLEVAYTFYSRRYPFGPSYVDRPDGSKNCDAGQHHSCLDQSETGGPIFASQSHGFVQLGVSIWE